MTVKELESTVNLRRRGLLVNVFKQNTTSKNLNRLAARAEEVRKHYALNVIDPSMSTGTIETDGDGHREVSFSRSGL